MKMRVTDMNNAMSSLIALRKTLSAELDHTERYIEILAASTAVDRSIDASGELAAIYRAAGAQLRSGMASLDEIFGWVILWLKRSIPIMRRMLNPSALVFSVKWKINSEVTLSNDEENDDAEN